jgi:hypothetical protein
MIVTAFLALMLLWVLLVEVPVVGVVLAIGIMGTLVALIVYGEIVDVLGRPEREEARQAKRRAAEQEWQCAKLAKQAEDAERRRAKEAEREQREREQAEEARARWITAEGLRYKQREHLENPEWLARHAAKEMTPLLERREEILRATECYHLENEGIEILKKHSPETYERAQWEVKALAIAERLHAETPALPSPALQPKETREEWLARQLRHKSHLATGVIALARQEKVAAEELCELNLDPDEHERRRAALREIYADRDPQEEAYHAKKL